MPSYPSDAPSGGGFPGMTAGLGGLGSLLGGFGAQAEAERQRKLFRKVKKSYLAQLGRFDTSMNRAEGLTGQILGDIGAGYGKAASNLAGGGYSAKMGIMDRAKQQGASMTQGLVSSGLGNSTIAQSAKMGLHASTSRALASVDESVAQALAGLQVQRTGAEAAAKGGLANFITGRAQGDLANRQDFLNFYLSQGSIPSSKEIWLNAGAGMAGDMSKLAGMSAMGLI